MRLDYVSLSQRPLCYVSSVASLANPTIVLTCDPFGANFKYRGSVACMDTLIRASARAVSFVHAASLNCFRWNLGSKKTSLRTT